MSFEPDRNPSPPPEILNDEEFLPDRIADTVYSKRWTLKTLMNIVEACYNLKETSEQCDESNSANAIVELDTKVEEDACTLWDMSATKAVANFLVEANSFVIFLDIIENTKSPRLLEIIIGILGNMCTFSHICQLISENKDLVHTILALSGTTDTPSLIQVFRLIISSIRNPGCQDSWFKSFEENPFFMENMRDILLNSLNDSVILSTYQLLFHILIENVSYAETWSQEAYMKSVLVAGQQLLKLEACLDIFFCVLNSLCQYTPNVETFVDMWDDLKPLFNNYIDCLGKEECLFESGRVSSVYSYFDTYNTLFLSGSMKFDSIMGGMDVFTSMARVSVAVNNLIQNVRKHNLKVVNFKNPAPEQDDNILRRVEQRKGSQCVTILTQSEFHTWNVLAETLIDVAKGLLEFVEKEEERDVLNNIVNSDLLNENIGVLII